jgi:COMPASS component SWD3
MLCMLSLLSSRSVLDAPSFKGWEGIQPAREKLAEQLQYMMDQERSDREGDRRSFGSTLVCVRLTVLKGPTHVPPRRLVALLRQAAEYQIGTSMFRPKGGAIVHSYVLCVRLELTCEI